MKKVLVIAVALASVSAFATRARVTALGSNPTLVDTQTVYSNPSDMMVLGDYVNFESGTTAGGAENANSEGMITRSMGDSKLGLSLGHESKNASIWGLRHFSAMPVMTSQQNPVELSYGIKLSDMLLGATLVYSNFNDKVNGIKESSGGFRLGMRMGSWDAKLGVGLLNTYEDSSAIVANNGKFKGTLGLSGGFGYAMDDLYLNAAFEMAGFKNEDLSGTETKKFDGTTYSVNATKSVKHDGNTLFYGVGLTTTTLKQTVAGADAKTTTMAMPITLGMEADAATWLTLRGSVTQSTVINSSKTDSAIPAIPSTETAPGVNSTTANVGAGFKFNKLNVDGTFSKLTGGSANGNLNGNDFLTTVGVTYWF